QRGKLDGVARVQSAGLLQREGNSFFQQKRRFFHHVAMAAKCDDEIRSRFAAQRAEIGIARAAEPRCQGLDTGSVRVADAHDLYVIDLQGGAEIERQVPMRGSDKGEFHGTSSDKGKNL